MLPSHRTLHRYTFGTRRILIALLADRPGSYARHYWRALRWRRRSRGWQHPAVRKRPFAAAIDWGIALAFFGGCFLLSPCAYFVWFTVFGINPVWLAWGLTAICLLLIGGGLVSVMVRIARAAQYEHARRNWDYLLVLPVPRDVVLLGTVAHAYAPLLSLIGLLVMVPALVMGLPHDAVWRWLIMLALLIVEWMQLQALSVTLGLVSAARFSTLGHELVAALVGAGLLVLRALGGWLALVWFGMSPGALRAGLIIGPLVRIGAPGAFWRALIIALAYLLLLELAVRIAFTWRMVGAGEREI